MTSEAQQSRKRQQQKRIGVVTSNSGDKTVRVTVNTLVKHPMYGKYVRRRTKLIVHDPSNAANPGDVVEIVPSRRISKRKSWRLARIVKPGAGTEASSDTGE